MSISQGRLIKNCNFNRSILFSNGHFCYQLNRVGQEFCRFGIQADFESSIRYFDAKIELLGGYKVYLVFPSFGVSYEFAGKFGYDGFLFSVILV